MKAKRNEGGRVRMTARQRRRSMTYAMVGAIHSLIGAVCVGSGVLTLVALKLGAGEVYLGLLSFAFLGSWMCRIFTMSAVEKHGKRKVIIFWKSVSTLCIIAFLVVPPLAGRCGATVCLSLILIATFVRTGTYALGNTGWFPLLQDIVPRQITGRFFANLRIAWQSACLVTLLLVAWFLGKDPGWWKFEIVFIVALAAYAIRVTTVIPMVENPLPPAAPKKISILERFAEVLRQRHLRRLIWYIIAYMVAAIIAEPFKIKLLKDLGYSDGFILAAIAMVSLGAIISLRFWGKLADKFGNHSIFTISHVGMIVSTFLWVFVGTARFDIIFVCALYLFWSIFNSGNGIAQTRYLLHAVPADKQNQINIINVIASLALGVAPLFGGLFLKLTPAWRFAVAGLSFNNYHVLFVIAAALFLVPHILRKELKHKKDTPTLHVLAVVTRPLLRTIGPFLGVQTPPNRE